MVRNVLIIAYYFPPMGLSGVQRTLKFVKYLPEFGWHPHVLTIEPSAYYAFDESLLADLDPDKVTIHRTRPDLSKVAKRKDGKPIKYPSRFMQRLKRMALQTVFQPDSRISWKKAAIELGNQIIEENDIHAVFATAPPFTDFLVADALAEKHGLGFVLDYRDLWVDNAYYFWATPFHKSYSIGLETSVLTHAKRAIVINRYMKETMLRRYSILSHEDISIIPHGYDSADFAGKHSIRPSRDKFTLTHSGLFPDDLTPKYFFKALAKFLTKNPEAKHKLDARFVGIMRKGHLKYIKKYKLDENVTLKGYVPHNEAIENLLESDVLWFMIPNVIATPSRMYEYIGARKPMIVCAPEGNIRQTAMESGATISCDPKNVNEICTAIETFYNLWKTNRLPEPNEDYVNSFDRKNLTGLLARELALSANV